VEAGDSIGRYRIDGLLARGGMAEVYRASARGPAGFGKDVALKLPLTHVVEDDELSRMFIDEARVAAKLNHRNIVSILELGVHKGGHFIAMELVVGTSLSRLLKKSGAIPRLLALTIGAELAAGLHYAHTATDSTGESLRVIHRDVCPSNVLVSDRGEVKLVDFGIAKTAMRTQHTEASVIRGKVMYLSPEQANLDPVGPQADQFSLGLVLYEMLTGERMYASNNDLVILDQARSADVREAIGNLDAPVALRELLLRMLEKQPTNRYANLDEVRSAMLELRTQLDPDETDDELHKRLANRVEPMSLKRSPATPAAQPRRLRWWVLAAALVFIIGGGLASFVLGPGTSSFAPATAVQPPAPRIRSNTLLIVEWNNPSKSASVAELTLLGPALLSERLGVARTFEPIAWFRYAQRRQKPPSSPTGWRLEADVHGDQHKVSVSFRLRDPNGDVQSRWTAAGPVSELPTRLTTIARQVAASFNETLHMTRAPGSFALERLRRQALSRARAHSETGYRGGIRKMRELSTLSPKDPEPYLWAGVFAWWSGPAGLSWFEDIGNDARKAGVTQLVPAALAVMKGFVQDGHASHYDAAAKLASKFPRNPFVMFLLGEAEVHTGKVERGAKRLLGALRLEPSLYFARHHPLDIALLRRDKDTVDRLISLRARDPTDSEVKRLRVRRAIALGQYGLALASITKAPGQGQQLTQRLLLQTMLGRGTAAEAELERLVRRGSGSYPLYKLGLALAIANGPAKRYEHWLKLALPVGRKILGTKTSPHLISDLRFAAGAQILELMSGRKGDWDAVTQKIAKAIGRLTTQDKRLLLVVRALTAFSRKQVAVLTKMRSTPHRDLAELVEGLRHELRGNLKQALVGYQGAANASPDGRFLPIIYFSRVRAARAGKRPRTAEVSCKELLRPASLGPFDIVARRTCLGANGR